MRICERALNFVQIIDHEGTVRICGWLKDNIIGKLSESSFEEIWKGEKAERLRKKLMAQDYSSCIVDACPYLSMGTMDEHTVELEELPEYPEAIHLAFEEVCNYNCTSCTTPETMRCNQGKDLEAGYRMIEERLQNVLPHIKRIGANGRGELFASKRTLRMLSKWRPIAPREECSVYLETNGSLFDAEHWRQIENLGQYHLSVAVTVMSFDERTYQILSGTKLPISQVEDNLRFVKRLREKGIVDYFEIATVYQERNFRTLPDFARRAVEEFGADYVRLRPYAPWGSNSPDVEWFFDVRGKHHPYHGEFLEVMRDPIFRHPKVHDWGGGLDSASGELPSVEHVKAELAKQSSMLSEYRKLCAELVTGSGAIKRISEALAGKSFLVYGLGAVGQALVKKLWEWPGCVGILDCHCQKDRYMGLSVHHPKDAPEAWRSLDVLITPLTAMEDIKEQLAVRGYTGRQLDVYQILKTGKGV